MVLSHVFNLEETLNHIDEAKIFVDYFRNFIIIVYIILFRPLIVF